MQTYIENHTPEITTIMDIVGKHFFRFILNLHYKDLTLSEAWLSDYSGSGLTPEMFEDIADHYDIIDKRKMLYSDTKNLYYKLRFNYWEQLIKNQILMYYNVSIDKIDLPLLTIFEKILKNNSIFVLEQQLNQPQLSFLPNFVFQPHCSTTEITTYTQEQIDCLLKTTTNPIFYAQYSGSSLETARIIVAKRQISNHTIYKAYRPNIANYENMKYA
jgi:hypothetical protein